MKQTIEKIPDDIKSALKNACTLHGRAAADDTRCMEFTRLRE